jgi:hypothetical protein
MTTSETVNLVIQIIILYFVAVGGEKARGKIRKAIANITGLALQQETDEKLALHRKLIDDRNQDESQEARSR